MGHQPSAIMNTIISNTNNDVDVGRHRQMHRHSIAIPLVAAGFNDDVDDISTDTNNRDHSHTTGCIDGGEHFLGGGRTTTTTTSTMTRRTMMLPREWIVDDTDVKEVPEIYPRLSYPLIIRPNKDNNFVVDVGLIGNRLLDFLKVNNVRSVYDDQRGRVFCYSPKVSFVVQFWKRKCGNSEEGGEEEEEIILEIQRRQGCSYSMHKIRTALKKSILPSLSSSSSSNNNVCNEPYSKNCDSEMMMMMIHYHRQRRMSPTSVVVAEIGDDDDDDDLPPPQVVDVVRPIRYESLLKQQQESYRPSSNIKRMYERHGRRLGSAPPRLLVQSLVGIDRQLFSS